ncbi:MAG: ATP-dependent DNA helicase [SAR324 cluster bacterium]|nr:ATP-dependent DNA helicase [SAR324 cluster bacterium]
MLLEKTKPAHSFQVSVKELVEFCCRQGDLNFGSGPSPAAQEGIRGHQLVQRNRPKDYEAEVSIRHTVSRGNIELQISGRIDGVFLKEKPVIVEEIKTTYSSMLSLPSAMRTLHLAQAKVYACLFCREHPDGDHPRDSCQIQMTYFQLEKQDEESTRESFSYNSLSEFFESLMSRYFGWLEKIVNYQNQRDRSIQGMEFPYNQYRPGQRELAVKVYRTISAREQLMVQAPTGIGKTVSTLFPAIKAIGEKEHDLIFYLTAKTVGRRLVEKMLAEMETQGLVLKSMTLTAKDKICFCRNGKIKESTCPYTEGYYDRLPQALEELFEYNGFTRSLMENLAEKHRLCPFELSLDLSYWLDIIIGDYNHVFHPTASLRRFQEDKKRRKTLLIDEAHNLVDRARTMFTASLSKSRTLQLYRAVKPVNALLAKRLQHLNRVFLSLKKVCESEDDSMIQREEDIFVGQKKPEMAQVLEMFCETLDHCLFEGISLAPDREIEQALIDFYFDVRHFLRIDGLYDKHFVSMVKFHSFGKSRAMEITLYCLDPSAQLNSAFHLSHSAILFSGTLCPFFYYSQVLGLEENVRQIDLSSPFPPANLGLFIASHIKTNFQNRERFYAAVAALILNVIQSCQGKYLVCFPSYRYLEAVRGLITEQLCETEIIAQTPQMDDASREEFLNRFVAAKPSGGLLGFAIMGGLFGEGIDLPGKQLIGVIVVSVGLPQICIERELIKEYYDKQQWPGFSFAYQFPGMNRVLQTAGRVIRSSSDTGVVVLVDERFAQHRYRQLFPRHWHYLITPQTELLKSRIEQFWEGIQNEE